MASTEQPLKKRKLYESVTNIANLNQTIGAVPLPPSLSQDEIVRKWKNREEIRNLYESYLRIRFCISQKGSHLMPDLEQAYLSLITASRGCTSVQRVVAELIPRYAAYCPTALEAAARVVINMYHWNLALVMKEEDADGIAFHTAVACVSGLVNICVTSASVGPTSSVIGGICAAVFLNVLTFFISTFEGKDIYQIGDEEIEKMIESTDIFSKIKEKVITENGSPFFKLFKFRALCLLRIFFSCPRHLLAACFQLFESSALDVGGEKGGYYFLRQVTSQLPAEELGHQSSKKNDEASAFADSVKDPFENNENCKDKSALSDSKIQEKAFPLLKKCFLEMVIRKDPSFGSWAMSRYKKLCESASSETISNSLSSLEEFFKSLKDLVAAGTRGETDKMDQLVHSSDDCLMPKNSSILDSSPGLSGKTCTVQVNDAAHIETSYETNKKDIARCASVDHSNSFAKSGSDSQSTNENLNPDREGSVSIRITEGPDIRVSTRKDLGPIDTNPSCKHSSNLHHTFSTSHVWYFDGDHKSMDVFAASNQLWLGSLGSRASENLVRFKCETFGPVQQFLFNSVKGFALVEYRNIMDAISARHCMQETSPWGSCLCLKFLDTGIGSRGSVSGAAVGACCHVYIGKVQTQWDKDEIMHELLKLGVRAPRVVTDLTAESALLLEFETAEEAALVMSYLRLHRRENGYNSEAPYKKLKSVGSGCSHVLVKHIDSSVSDEKLLSAFSAFGEIAGWKSMRQNGSCWIDFCSPEAADLARTRLDGARFGGACISVEFRINNIGDMYCMSGSPNIPVTQEGPANVSRSIVSQLSTLFEGLCTKYNINHFPRSNHANTLRDEDKGTTNTLWIGLPDMASPYFLDDDILAICSLAVGHLGSVTRLTRANMQRNSSWLVEYSSVDAAVGAIKNIRACPSLFFQVQFRMKVESCGPFSLGGPGLPSNWNVSSNTNILDGSSRRTDVCDASKVVNPSAGIQAVPHATEQMWMHKRHEVEQQIGTPQTQMCQRTIQGSSIPPPLVQTSSFRPPIYQPSNIQNLNPSTSLRQISPGVLHHNYHVNSGIIPPFPPSITPLARLPNNTIQQYPVAIPSVAPPLTSPRPPPPNVTPHVPPSPPPLPLSQPPSVPPPPSSPPPTQQINETSKPETVVHSPHYQWKGALCKSGVQYCTIVSTRENTDLCKYTNGLLEPAEWPTRLDMTKRTDFRHVRSTFTNTPPHKREVCRLLPSSDADLKGFQDFISYLRQKECAGVIKLPAGTSIWARLLFILPNSPETCALFSISSHPGECLVGLVLPKETNFDWI